MTPAPQDPRRDDRDRDTSPWLDWLGDAVGALIELLVPRLGSQASALRVARKRQRA